MDMIDEVLPAEFQQMIVDTIKQQCYCYKQIVAQEKKLYYEPYSNRRSKYKVTAAVLSGFAPDRFMKDGIEVKDLCYGLRTNSLVQPELITDTAVLQLYSNTATPYKNNIVLERCQQYNGAAKENRRFIIIRFWVDKIGNLKRIEAHYPDENGKILESKILYKRTIIALRASTA